MQSGKLLRLALTVATFGATTLGLASCTDEKIVYREKQPPAPPPAAAANFIGYVDTASKTTVCGTCHSDIQATWSETKHASAWKDLQANPGAAAYCEGCHTVGQLGNGADSANVGWTATKDHRYYDVQCESCHGAGGNHVGGPTLANIPKASIAIPTATNAEGALTTTDGCAACHQGSHHPFAEEWIASPHGQMPFTSSEFDHVVGNGSGCGAKCHSAQTALQQRFGVMGAFKENVPITSATWQKLGCVVCHDPHAENNPAQLRLGVVARDSAQNICVRCHSRSYKAGSSFRGPHSPEGPTVFGYKVVGWRPVYNGVAYMDTVSEIHGTHGDTVANTKVCVNCHMPTYTVTKPDNSTQGTTGHLFLATACLDADGVPTASEDCAMSQRTFKGCTGSGCHGSETVARSALTTAVARINNQLATLRTMIYDTTKVTCAELQNTSSINPARGARYNYLLAVGHRPEADVADACTNFSSTNEEQFWRSLPPPQADIGQVAHNPFYIEQLLDASIRAMKAKYGF